MENDKKYCRSFRTHSIEIKDNFKGWYIEYTDNLDGYSLTSDKYSQKNIFDTEQEAINSVRQLREKEVPFMKIGY